MTYVVTDACIKCKYMDCVEVCPVDCFYEGEVMLVINPNECIDCGVCEPECPAEAILPNTESGQEKWLELNSNFSAEWPNITRKKDSPADADEHKGEEGKYDKYFTPEGGEGDYVATSVVILLDLSLMLGSCDMLSKQGESLCAFSS